MLRGLGVTMALPWLESLPVWGDEPAGTRSASEPPVRLAVLFSGNGFHSKEWWAKGEGKDMELGKVLAPLADFREKLLFIRGLYNEEALKGNIHSSQTGNLLSGAPLASGGEIRSGTSIDQLARPAPRPLDQGAQPGAGLREVEPVGAQELLDALQLAHLVELADDADAAGALPGPGLRPAVQGRGRSRATRACSTPCSPTPATSAAQISTTDQRKLDEYLDSVREVEQRIEQAGKAGELQGWRPTLDKPNIPRPRRRHSPGHRRAHAADVRHPRARLPDRHDARSARSSSTTTTRRCGSRTSGVDYMIHHLLSHSDTADWLKVNQFFVEQLAYIARKLDAIQEGERTALDNSMILFCSSMLTGSHDATQLPVVMLGRRRRPDQDRPRARLPRQAEPQDVQPVPVAAGQGRRAPRPLRRRDRAAGGGVSGSSRMIRRPPEGVTITRLRRSAATPWRHVADHR